MVKGAESKVEVIGWDLQESPLKGLDQLADGLPFLLSSLFSLPPSFPSCWDLSVWNMGMIAGALAALIICHRIRIAWRVCYNKLWAPTLGFLMQGGNPETCISQVMLMLMLVKVSHFRNPDLLGPRGPNLEPSGTKAKERPLASTANLEAVVRCLRKRLQHNLIPSEKGCSAPWCSPHTQFMAHPGVGPGPHLAAFSISF